MEIANLQHGRILTLEVVPLTDVGLEKIPANRREITLTRAGDLCALILPGQDQPLLLNATDQKSQRDLQRVMNQETPACAG